MQEYQNLIDQHSDELAIKDIIQLSTYMYLIYLANQLQSITPVSCLFVTQAVLAQNLCPCGYTALEINNNNCHL